MSCNHNDNEEMRKWSTVRSQAVDQKLLLHVESREGAEQPHRKATTHVVL